MDAHTGDIVTEPDHPLEGLSLKDGILILEGSRGSNGWSIFFHAAQVAGFGPAGLVFPRLDSRTALTAAVLNVPLVTDLDTGPFDIIRLGDRVREDGDGGLIVVVRNA